MATDIILDQGDGNTLVLQGNAVKVEAADVIVDSPARRGGNSGSRRALVHNAQDGLTINYNGDYPGGVTIYGVTAITPKQGAVSPSLAVHGGITFQYKTVSLIGPGAHYVTADLNEELNKLHARINELTARVTALEANR